jgi:Mn-dependent DtxR family transcriptional regulator
MDAVRSHLESAGGPVRLSEITSALGFSTIVAKNTLQKMKSLGHVGVEGNTRSASWKLLTEQKGQ